MAIHTIKRGNNKLTLSINKEILKCYKQLCHKEGLIISKQVEKFMNEELKRR